VSKTRYLFNFGLEKYFIKLEETKPRTTDRFIQNVSRFMLSRLSKCAEFLDEHNLFFESAAADDLKSAFENTYHQTHPSSEDFQLLWNDLMEWGDIDVHVSGSGKSIVKIPSLPHQFT